MSVSNKINNQLFFLSFFWLCFVFLVGDEGNCMLSKQRGPLTAEEVILKYNLKGLPGEGGYYNEVYRFEQKIDLSDISKESSQILDGNSDSIIVGNSKEQKKNLRSTGTSIYFMMTSSSIKDSQVKLKDGSIVELKRNNFSAFHRLKNNDEMWYFLGGDPVQMFQINEKGEVKEFILGVGENQLGQVLVPVGVWQGSRVFELSSLESPSYGYSLVATACFPGFDFQDLEVCSRQSLSNNFPGLQTLIWDLTRE